MIFSCLLSWLPELRRGRPGPGKVCRRAGHPGVRPRYARPVLEELEGRLTPAVVLNFLNPVPTTVQENQPVTLVVQATQPPEEGGIAADYELLLGGNLLATASSEGGPVKLPFTLGEDAEGTTQTLTVTASSDGGGASQSFSVQVIENQGDTPTLAPIPNQTISAGQTVSLTAFGKGDDPPDQLAYSLTQAPPGAAINPSTGAFTWATAPGQSPGVYPVSVRVTIAGQPAAFTEQGFFITVNPAPGAPTPPTPPTPPNPFVNNTLIVDLTGGPPPAAAASRVGFIPDLAVTLPPVVTLAQGQPAALPQFGAGAPDDPTPAALLSAGPLDLPLNLDRATPRPLRLSDTETASDGSSVERLYRDFFSPTPGNVGTVSSAPAEESGASEVHEKAPGLHEN
jgi:hypothetical protein